MTDLTYMHTWKFQCDIHIHECYSELKIQVVYIPIYLDDMTVSFMFHFKIEHPTEDFLEGNDTMFVFWFLVFRFERKKHRNHQETNLFSQLSPKCQNSRATVESQHSKPGF